MDFDTIIIYTLTYIGFFAFSFYFLTIKAAKKENIPLEAEDKTVTIIIPAYNEEKTIAKTIESALSSKYPKDKLEIIVVSDGSTDKTYEIAKKYEASKKFKVKVYQKKNGGKASALNFGIAKAKGEIIFTMDADSFIKPETVRRMVARFYKKEVMSVTPSMGVYKPKKIIERIQQIEYYIGVFLRKSFAELNALYVTPGAFSAYRKEFFDKYGGYDENNITEDLEIALRIQSKDYIIENAPEAVVYTVAPKTFRDLLIQRRRWYSGWIKNLWRYRELFSPKKGLLGIFVLPLAVISIPITMYLTSKIIIKSISNIEKEINLLNSINFEFQNTFEFSRYFIKTFLENLFYGVLSDPLVLIGIFFVVFLFVYLSFSKKKMRHKESLKIGVIFFLLFYSILFSIWWITSIIYVILNKKVIWRKNEKN